MTSSHEPPPSTALVAGKYQLIGLIGRGGMGSVWEGRHATLGTRVAIKFIEAEYANSQDARSRFDNEARAAATIQSKHAIQIFDHGVTEDGKPYIVMEMLEGEPLDKRIDRLGRLTLQDTARILQQVSRALTRAHEKGIIHRDLKPENIFLVRSPDDDDEIAKVLDFGIAKIKSNPGEMGISSSTKTGAVLGTPFYMSPEQARGLRTIDHRTDIWSLGVIAFKCATGKLPFDGESVGDLLVKICTSPIPVPSQVMPGLPPGFDAWFSRVMEREPERRFGTVLEMSDALAYAAGITMRQASSGGSAQPMYAPQSPQPQSPQSMTPGYGAGPSGMQAGMQAGPSAATERQGSAPSFGERAQALSGTQAPYTKSAQPGAQSRSSKAPILVSVGLVVAVGVAAATGVVYFERSKVAAKDPASLIDSTSLAAKGAPAASDLPTKQPDPVMSSGAGGATAGANDDTPGTPPLGSAKPSTNARPGAGSLGFARPGSKPPNGTSPTQTKPVVSAAPLPGRPGSQPASQPGPQPGSQPGLAGPQPANPLPQPPRGKVDESGI